MTRFEAHDLLQRWLAARHSAAEFARARQAAFTPDVPATVASALTDAMLAVGKTVDELQTQILAAMCGKPEATQ